MPCVRVLAAIGLAFVLSGCINSGTLIRVKPDGSGTIEQTVLMNVAAVKSMMSGLGAQGKTKEGPFNEADLKRAAERMGKGVRFVSSTPLKEGAFEGAKAIFAFDDISQVQIEQDPNIGSSSGAMSMAKKPSPVTFKLAREGPTSALTITFDEGAARGAAPANPPGTPDTVDPAMLQMMKVMFQGFKVAIDLEVDGKIVKTNADYVNGSRITLLEIDLAALLEDEAKLRALQSKMGPGASIADVKPYLKDVKGVKINHSVVTIEYR
jgi:hypothetical protein